MLDDRFPGEYVLIVTADRAFAARLGGRRAARPDPARAVHRVAVLRRDRGRREAVGGVPQRVAAAVNAAPRSRRRRLLADYRYCQNVGPYVYPSAVEQDMLDEKEFAAVFGTIPRVARRLGFQLVRRHRVRRRRPPRPEPCRLVRSLRSRPPRRPRSRMCSSHANKRPSRTSTSPSPTIASATPSRSNSQQPCIAERTAISRLSATRRAHPADWNAFGPSSEGSSAASPHRPTIARTRPATTT